MESARDPEVGLLRLPPQSIEAEQSVLGSLLLDNTAFDRIADILRPEDFYRADHRQIYGAIAALIDKVHPADVVTVHEALSTIGKAEESGGLVYLNRLAQDTPSAANIRRYAEIVRDRSVLRRLIAVADEIANNALNPQGKDTRTLLDEAETKIFQIGDEGARGRSGFQSLPELLSFVVDRISELYDQGNLEGITGVPTGFSDLDQMTSGLQAGDLIVVAGRPAMGKTAFALNIAEHVAVSQSLPVAVFSMEMGAAQLAMRLLCSAGRLDQQRVRTGQLSEADWPRLTTAIQKMQDAQLFIDESPGLNALEVRSRARKLARQCGQLGLVIVDYLQLMSAASLIGENRATEIGEISRSLKGLAKELKCPVVALSQLNRSLEQRPNKRPVMSDLRECVVGSTPVALAGGGIAPIRALQSHCPKVLAMNRDQRIVAADSNRVWSLGKRPVYRLHLEGHYMLTATLSHRVYSKRGWLTLGELCAGDQVAVVPQALKLRSWQTDTPRLVAWSAFAGLEEQGEEEVFDLTVPGPASWLSGGIVSHNSGAIEQDADVIVFIYRDEVYNPDSPEKGTAEIIIGKQRNGPIGTVRLTFIGKHTKFENFVRG
jgi:replicative DNA helicase